MNIPTQKHLTITSALKIHWRTEAKTAIINNIFDH